MGTPEQIRAVQVLKEALGQWKKYLVRELPSKMFETNYMAFSTEPFHKLPNDGDWHWNQSNAKVTTYLDNGEEVVFQKMNTRKKKNCIKAPSYKIWVYHITLPNNSSQLHFVWCEK